jgi:hypothetical protein
MKNALRLIIVLSFIWVAFLIVADTTARPESLDVVLPQRILTAATPDEREQITSRLTALHRPSVFSWIPPIGVLLLSSYALLALPREG